jgi:signal recognition particle receptor subunit beta
MHVNWIRQEIIFKIIYYGPGLGGKTTNLEYIYHHIDPVLRSKLVSLKTKEERTLYFDFLQIELGRIRGKKPRFHLYTVPGQVHYSFGRRILLKGSDAVVFVADSQSECMANNLEALMDLEQHLNVQKKTLATFPWVLQYNKRDLPNIDSVNKMQQRINFLHVPHHEAVATQGKGVFETLASVIQLLLKIEGREKE